MTIQDVVLSAVFMKKDLDLLAAHQHQLESKSTQHGAAAVVMAGLKLETKFFFFFFTREQDVFLFQFS